MASASPYRNAGKRESRGPVPGRYRLGLVLAFALLIILSAAVFMVRFALRASTDPRMGAACRASRLNTVDSASDALSPTFQMDRDRHRTPTSAR